MDKQNPAPQPEPHGDQREINLYLAGIPSSGKAAAMRGLARSASGLIPAPRRPEGQSSC